MLDEAWRPHHEPKEKGGKPKKQKNEKNKKTTSSRGNPHCAGQLSNR
jgi:hypothetical protein